MKVDLDKKDLIYLIKGIKPEISIHKKLKDFGEMWEYNSENSWQWNFYKLNQLTEESLFEIYELCKNSWE